MVTKQVVLVTGASTGFGRLIAETLARQGHTVFATMRDLAGRNASNASEIRELAKKESLSLHLVELDVADEASAERAARDCVQQAGRIDAVINNAGFVVVGLAECVTLEQARRQMDTNFFGVVIVNRAVLPYMRKQRSGLLLHVSSGAGRVAIPGFAFYCASKFALEALAETYRYELAGQGIESSIVEPGPYKTAVFNNTVQAADNSRSETYGAANEFASKMFRTLDAAAGNPQDLADVIVSIVETPAGQRQLRYRVSPTDMGIDDINAVCEKVQTRVLGAFGIASDTAFVQRTAAGSAGSGS
jgi:NAD(P)-dependent dehydrogenase (short-subunit alcohol dehydrogenase family)